MHKLNNKELEKKREDLRKKHKKKIPFFVLLENIRSLYNVGSVFRTSDACLVDKIYLAGYTGHPPRKEINKTALGAEEVVPWEYHKDQIALMKKLKEEGVEIIVLEQTAGSIPYTEFKPYKPFCLVLGHEVDGVSQKLTDLADVCVDIPMLGTKQSLNVSVAFGVVAYHLTTDL